MLLIAVIGLHAGLAIAIKILFFASGSPVSQAGDDKGASPPPEGGAEGDKDKGDRLVRMLFGA